MKQREKAPARAEISSTPARAEKLMTVKEVSRLCGLTVRTLQYYDKIGLLKAPLLSEAGYRLYDDEALETLQQIMLFRELEFSLEEIKQILYTEDFDRDLALTQQINLLRMKKRHIEDIIKFAKKVKSGEQEKMDFKAFDTSKMDSYAKHAKDRWGQTEAYAEYEDKMKGKSKQAKIDMAEGLMAFFEEFGKMRDINPSEQVVQESVKKLQKYITDNYYNCTNEILAGLGMMYVHDEDFRKNIDRAGGEGTAKFVGEAIMIYCK